MTLNSNTGWVMLCGAMIAGQAAHWFISGANDEHSFTRNLMVVIQLLAGIALLIYSWHKVRVRKNKMS